MVSAGDAGAQVKQTLVTEWSQVPCRLRDDQLNKAGCRIRD